MNDTISIVKNSTSGEITQFSVIYEVLTHFV